MSVAVSGLTKMYGAQRAVDDISFEVAKGEILGFLGPNGAGKSTTMKIITCFIPQTEGIATVSGFDTEKDSMEVRKRVGYLPESNPLYYDMYVKEYLQFVAKAHGLGKQTKQRIEEMIELTGLKVERRKKIGQLSKGYKQRVGIAQAMIHDPEVLILDEPTSGLDPNQLREIRGLIKKLGEEKTVILSTHIMQEVEAMCDRVVIINQGKLVADSTIGELKQKVAGEVMVHVEFAEEVSLSQLKGISGVDKVVQEKGSNWILSGKGKTDLRGAVFNFAKEHNLTLLSLRQESSNLEEIFQQLTQ